MRLPDGWTVPKGVYEPREDSYLMASVLSTESLTDMRVLDMGTGSGIQAFVAADRGADVTAVDLHETALAAAKANLSAQGCTARFIRSDLFESVEAQYDLIVFNPPYVPGEIELGTPEEDSWRGGEAGREVIDRFLEAVSDYLASDGRVLLLQSSLNGIDETITRCDNYGLQADIAAEQKVPWERLVILRCIRN